MKFSPNVAEEIQIQTI